MKGNEMKKNVFDKQIRKSLCFNFKHYDEKKTFSTAPKNISEFE